MVIYIFKHYLAMLFFLYIVCYSAPITMLLRNSGDAAADDDDDTRIMMIDDDDR